MRARSAFVLSLVAALALACKSSDKDDSKPAETSGSGGKSATNNEKEPPPEPSERGEGEVHRNLIDDVGRAELRTDGLVINLGTSDQHKFTRGGWKTGWDVSDSKKPSAGVTSWSKGTFDVLIDGKPVELVVRARSLAGNHSVVPYIDSTALGREKLSQEWKIYRFPIKEAVEPGSHTLSMRFGTSGKDHTEVDWVWLSDKEGAELPPIEPLALPVSIGESPKRSLVAPKGRSYSYYIEPVKGERLIVDVGSEVGATFEVRAHTDGSAKPDVLWSGKGTGKWKEVVVDLSKYAGKAVRLELATDDKAGVSGWAEPVLQRQPEKLAKGTGGAAKNVLYILIDTARADAFKPGSVAQTPAYDDFASKSTRFEHAYNNENWTKPSVATVLSGTYPSTHKTKEDASSVPEDLELISEHLKKAGFATSAYIANGYVSNKFGFEKGWDQFTNYIREGKRSEAERVYGDAMEWLEKHSQEKPGQRYFLYIQTIDPHVVYRVDDEYWKKYYDKDSYNGKLGNNVTAANQTDLGKQNNVNPDDVNFLKALYYGEITYHDEHFGKFLEAAEQKGFLKDTVIIVGNDHGEELGDRGRFGHGHSLYEELTASPLLIHFPPVFQAGRVVTDIVEHVDMVPTMLDLLGLPASPQAEGQSLVPLATGDPLPRPLYAITEFLDGRRAIRVGSYKLSRSSGTKIRIFNIAEDPGEDKDLTDTAHVARRLLETHLGEGLAVPQKSRRQRDLISRQSFEAGRADISPEMRRKFEALGYFGAKPEPID